MVLNVIKGTSLIISLSLICIELKTTNTLLGIKWGSCNQEIKDIFKRMLLLKNYSIIAILIECGYFII